MSSFARYVPPPPPPKPPRCTCNAFVPECLVPAGEGCIALCWYCAHAVEVHGADALDPDEIGRKSSACTCSAKDILPPDVWLKRRAVVDAASLEPFRSR